MAFPPAHEVWGVALATCVAALWVYAVTQWALAEVFEAPNATARFWPFGLAGIATLVFVAGMRSRLIKKRESK